MPDGVAHGGLDLLSTAVIVVDPDGRITGVNAAACALLDAPARHLVGQPLLPLFGQRDMLRGLLDQARRGAFGEKAFELSLARQPAPGTAPRPVLRCVATRLEPREREQARDGGVPAGSVLLELHDTGHLLRLEREDWSLDAARASREMIRNLAHEIKNPLGGIRGAAQLLQDELADPALHEYTQVVIREADRLHALLDRMLAPIRPSRQHVAFNVHELCERVRAIVLAEFDGIDVRRDYDTSLPELHGDPAQMIQVLLNLMRNAAQALGGHGRITLRTRIARQVVLARMRHRLALELHVIDDGPGIPDGLRERIFFPLVSAREGGTGLGLPLAQTYVEQHGGVIECESRPGCTDFRVLLPLLPDR